VNDGDIVVSDVFHLVGVPGLRCVVLRFVALVCVMLCWVGFVDVGLT